jgi:plastocyanin
MLVTVPTGENDWPVPGQVLYVQSAGYFGFLNPVGTTQMALINLRNDGTGIYASNAVSGPLVVGSEVGPAGIQGPVGPDGDVASVEVGTTTTLAPGEDATVVNSGTAQAAILDFGIPQGDVGPAGHSPVVTTVASNPTGAGGAAGDIRLYQPTNNNGTTTFYYNLAGTWTQGPTVLSSRLIGYSAVSATPNPGNVPVNVNDYYWSYVAGRLVFSVCSVAGTPGTWVTAIDILITGGSGAPVDAEYIVATSNPTLSAERVATATATIVPDTTVAGQMRWNIPDDGVTNAKLNNVPSNTFKGLGLGGPANPIDLTANQASTILDTATDPFVRTSAIPGGTSTFQSISDGSPVLGDGRQTGTNVWTMQRAIQYVPNAQSSAGVGTTLTFETDSYEQHNLTLTHDSVTLAYDPPVHDTANFLFSINNTTGGELSFLYSAGTWQANEGVTVPYTLLGGARVALIAHYYNGFMVITGVIQNTTTL